MKEVLETIVKNIVENPEAVSVTQKEEAEKVVLEVKVAESDMGRIIGKQGKIANSIRTLMKALAGREHKRVSVEFVEWSKNILK